MSRTDINFKRVHNITSKELIDVITFAIDFGVKLVSADIPIDKKNLSLSEAARYTKKSEYMLKKAIDSGELKAKKTGNSQNCKLMFKKIDLDLWVATKNIFENGKKETSKKSSEAERMEKSRG